MREIGVSASTVVREIKRNSNASGEYVWIRAQARADFDALRPILITDFTCELADLPEKPNSVKFTWRYGTNRVTLANPVADNIFTEPYNFIYR